MIDIRAAIQAGDWAGVREFVKQGKEIDSELPRNAALIASIRLAYPVLLDALEMMVVKAQKSVELDEGLALAMSAGARMIEVTTGKRGGTYLWDVFGAHKEIPYTLAAQALRDIATPFLTRAEAVAAMKGEGDAEQRNS